MLGSLHNALIEWNRPMNKYPKTNVQTVLMRSLSFIKAHLLTLSKSFDQCIICHNHQPELPQLCQHCYNNLPRFELDKVNGDLLNWPAIDQLFPKRHFDKLLSVTPHVWPISAWLNQFKYHRHYDLSALLAAVMQAQWEEASRHFKQPDIVLSVPLHISKWQSRGFNQAHLIALQLIQKNSLDYRDDVIAKMTKQHSQVGQTGSQRRKSLNGSFSVTKPKSVQNKTVLLIDDVLTTGSTVNEICRLLKVAGATEVIVMTLTVSLEQCQ